MQGSGSSGKRGGCGAGSSPRCGIPSCFPCQDFLPSLESSGVLTFEAQDLLCKKSRGFRGEKSNGLICLSLSQSIPAERGCEQTQLREGLSSWKLMDSVLLLEGYYLCFQNRTTKAQINPPSLGNCPLFCSPTGTRGCWSRFITETLSLLGSRARQGVPGEEKGTHPASLVAELPVGNDQCLLQSSWACTAGEIPSPDLHTALPKPIHHQTLQLVLGLSFPLPGT